MGAVQHQLSNPTNTSEALTCLMSASAENQTNVNHSVIASSSSPNLGQSSNTHNLANSWSTQTVDEVNNYDLPGSFSSHALNSSQMAIGSTCRRRSSASSLNNKLKSIVKKEQLEYEFRLKQPTYMQREGGRSSGGKRGNNDNDDNDHFLMRLFHLNRYSNISNATRNFSNNPTTPSPHNTKATTVGVDEEDCEDEEEEEDFSDAHTCEVNGASNQKSSSAMQLLFHFFFCCSTRNKADGRRRHDPYDTDSMNGVMRPARNQRNAIASSSKQQSFISRLFNCLVSSGRRSQAGHQRASTRSTSSSSNGSISKARRHRENSKKMKKKKTKREKDGNSYRGGKKKSTAALGASRSSRGDLFDAQHPPPSVTCIRVLRPSNDLTPVRFDSIYNIVHSASLSESLAGAINSCTDTDEHEENDEKEEEKINGNSSNAKVDEYQIEQV